MMKKCETTSDTRICGKSPRFKIVDIECGQITKEYDGFWVCDDCIKFFIKGNTNNPHYIIIEEKEKKQQLKKLGEEKQ